MDIVDLESLKDRKCRRAEIIKLGTDIMHVDKSEINSNVVHGPLLTGAETSTNNLSAGLNEEARREQ